MNQSDAMLVVKELAPVFRQFVAEAVAPLAAQIAALEARPVQAGIASALKSEAGLLVLTLNDGRTLDTGIRDGRDADPVTAEAVRPLVADEVAKQVAALPKPKDGEDARPEQIAEAVKAAVAEARVEIEAETIAAVDAAFAAIPKGPEGPTADEMKALVSEQFVIAADGMKAEINELRAALEALTPQVETIGGAIGEEIATHVATAFAKLVESLPSAKDGIGMAGGFIDRDGNLVLTSTDGKTHPVGHVVGKDGDPGKPGFGFEHIGVDYDGERTIKITFTRGDEVKEFPIVMPIVLDRGVYKEGRGYEPGDGVTWGGCYWIAEKSTTEKPGANDDWRLTVRKGRDGKTPKPTEKG